jgi:hypothetical protein
MTTAVTQASTPASTPATTRTRTFILRGVWRSACVLILGCAQIFGVDEACVAGGSGCKPAVDSVCVDYCKAVSDQCAETPQYDDNRPAECLALCPKFPRSPGIARGNTLECRMAQVNTMSGESISCKAAGRGGDGLCGTNCQSYCSLMKALCPAHFGEFDPAGSDAGTDADAADEMACLAVCRRLDDRPDYNPEVDGSDHDVSSATLQCRLWHLGAAAIELDAAGPDNSHCEHAVGMSPCFPTPQPNQ